MSVTSDPVLVEETRLSEAPAEDFDQEEIPSHGDPEENETYED